jgi:hypothetical protein
MVILLSGVNDFISKNLENFSCKKKNKITGNRRKKKNDEIEQKDKTSVIDIFGDLKLAFKFQKKMYAVKEPIKIIILN